AAIAEAGGFGQVPEAAEGVGGKPPHPPAYQENGRRIDKTAVHPCWEERMRGVPYAASCSSARSARRSQIASPGWRRSIQGEAWIGGWHCAFPTVSARNPAAERDPPLSPTARPRSTLRRASQARHGGTRWCRTPSKCSERCCGR